MNNTIINIENTGLSPKLKGSNSKRGKFYIMRSNTIAGNE
jgi:hypothetical protein